MIALKPTKIAALLVACISISVFLGAAKAAEGERPKVELVIVPKLECGPGRTGRAKGEVSGLKSFEGLQIVIYSYCDGIYYVQPTEKNPNTEIDKVKGEDKGIFETDIHGGQHYVALLVKDTYKAKPQIEDLPKVSGDVVAVSRKKLRPE